MRLVKLSKRERESSTIPLNKMALKTSQTLYYIWKRTSISSSGGQLDNIQLSMLLVSPVLGNPPNATCLTVMESVPAHVSL